MEYIMSIGEWDKISNSDDIMLEKYTESKGFFRNVGLSKVGEIRFYNFTEDRWLENLLTEEYRIYYMKLLCINKGLISTSYREEVPLVSIGDKKHNIPVEDRIKFLYESLSSNTNYNCLGIKYKDLDSRRHFESIFEIDSVAHIDAYAKKQSWFVDDGNDDDGITTFLIKDL